MCGPHNAKKKINWTFVWENKVDVNCIKNTISMHKIYSEEKYKLTIK